MTEEKNTKEPWYAPSTNEEPFLKKIIEKSFFKADGVEKPSKKKGKNFLVAALLELCAIFLSGLFFSAFIFHKNALGYSILMFILSLIFVVGGAAYLINTVGKIVSNSFSKNDYNSFFSLGLKVLQGKQEIKEPKKTIPAADLALINFVGQVRSYAAEVAYQKNRDLRNNNKEVRPTYQDGEDLLGRRWNELQDSLNEFEIYLANDPKLIIEKLVSKSPQAQMDVSQIFRDVAESFDTTWRRKGINIESAIVTPLKAVSNELLLRRLLVGPWRACAYFARRGTGVVFSAKSNNGKVIASWECNGLSVPEPYLEIVQNTSISVNERIELGMEALAPEPSSSNTFYALVSFITWIDLAIACNLDYAFKHTNSGFVIEIKL